MALNQAGLSAYWGFATLAVGYLMAAMGLILGAFGTIVNCLIFWDEDPAVGESKVS
jgi:hypothetical protein